jgi:hypothetical protein
MERNQINYAVKVRHCDGSRIMNVILKHLKQNEGLKVSKYKTPLHLRRGDEYIHEYDINFKNTAQANKLDTVKEEIIAAIPELFPVNYFFKIKGYFSTFETYGYRHEGCFIGIDGNKFDVYSKIKEQKKNSTEIEAYNILT